MMLMVYRKQGLDLKYTVFAYVNDAHGVQKTKLFLYFDLQKQFRPFEQILIGVFQSRPTHNKDTQNSS